MGPINDPGMDGSGCERPTDEVDEEVKEMKW
jgi:hypothetical protein